MNQIAKKQSFLNLIKKELKKRQYNPKKKVFKVK